MSYKVLECNVDDVGKGGVYSLVTNVIKHKSPKVNIDIASIAHFENKNNIENLKKDNCKIHYIGDNGNKLLRLYFIYKNMLELLKKNDYDCVHIHSDVSYIMYYFLLAAKKSEVKKIILHSHASGIDGKHRCIKYLLHLIYRRKILRFRKVILVACSDLAAKWMYPSIPIDSIKIISNGVCLNKFGYNKVIRSKVRNELNLNEKQLLIGNVGRFAYQKNHVYILQIFKRLLEKEKNAKLILVGEGKLKKSVEKKAKEMNLFDNIIFFGSSLHVNELLQAIDVFILPSHFEGLPISGVEAQAASIPTIFSNTITIQAKLLDSSSFLPIHKNNVEEWVIQILKNAKIQRIDRTKELREKGFDLESTINSFNLLYQ